MVYILFKPYLGLLPKTIKICVQWENDIITKTLLTKEKFKLVNKLKISIEIGKWLGPNVFQTLCNLNQSIDFNK